MREEILQKPSGEYDGLIDEAEAIINESSDMTSYYSSKVKSLEIDFVEQKKLIDSEVMALLMNRQAALYDEINPIREEHFDAVKSCLVCIVENVESNHCEKLNKKILECESTQDLFYVSKNMLLNNIQAVHDKNNECFVQIKKIINLFTPQTTSPAVFKLEEDVEKMGVAHVNFSNDFAQGTLIKEAVAELVKAQIPLPRSISVTPIIPMGTFGYSLGDSLSAENGGHVFLQTSSEVEFDEFMKKGIVEISSLTDSFKNASASTKSRYVKSCGVVETHLSSLKDIKEKFFNEVGRSFCPVSFESGTTKPLASQLFAKLMVGETLTEEQMELYLSLGGIVPKV